MRRRDRPERDGPGPMSVASWLVTPTAWRSHGAGGAGSYAPDVAGSPTAEPNDADIPAEDVDDTVPKPTAKGKQKNKHKDKDKPKGPSKEKPAHGSETSVTGEAEGGAGDEGPTTTEVSPPPPTSTDVGATAAETGTTAGAPPTDLTPTPAASPAEVGSTAAASTAEVGSTPEAIPAEPARGEDGPPPDAHEPRKPGGRLRRWGVGLLVVLSCLFLLLATVGIWGKNQVFDSDNFERIVVPIGEDPQVQRELATYLTDQLSKAVDPEKVISDALPDRAQILAPTLAGAVEDFVRSKVLEFLQSDTFQKIWREVVTRAHDRAILLLENKAANVKASGDKVTLNLVPVINEVIAAINKQTPAVFGRQLDVPTIDPSQPPNKAIRRLSSALGVELPKDFGQVTVYDDGKLSTAQDIFRWVEQGAVLLLVLALLLPIAAILLSRRRRRTVLQYVVGVAITMVLLRRLVYALERMVLDRVLIPARRPVVQGTYDRLMHNLLLATLWMLVFALVATMVLAATGPYGWARRTRGRGAAVGRAGWGAVGRLGVDATPDSLEGEITTWVRAHRSGLQVAGAVVAGLVLLVADLTWVGLLVILLLLLVFELVVLRW